MTWRRTTLGACCEVVSGATPATSEPRFWDGAIEWATPKDLSELNGKYIEKTSRRITQEGLSSCAATLLPPKAVLLSSRAPIGYVAINTVPMATNQGFKSLIPKPSEVDANFLYYWLRAKRHFLEDLGNGATFKEVSKAVVSRVEIALPPIVEQQRIAAILDKADAIRRKRKEAITLTEGLLRATFLEMFGDPERNSKGWEVKPLCDVVREGTIVTYGIVQAGPHIEGGVPYIRTGDIKNDRIVADGLQRTSKEIAARFQRSEVREGDLVMSIRATVGTVAVVPSNLDGANLTQGTARIAPGKDVTKDFLFEHIRTPGMQRWLRRQVKGATFKEITLGVLRTAPVMLPPKYLQEEFSAFCLRARKIANLQEQSKRDAVELFDSLLQRAFDGGLTC